MQLLLILRSLSECCLVLLLLLLLLCFVLMSFPAGKGVSSSAALEVSVMSAVAAAHNIKLGGREVALLCQKVEVRLINPVTHVLQSRQFEQLLAYLGTTISSVCWLLRNASDESGHVSSD